MDLIVPLSRTDLDRAEISQRLRGALLLSHLEDSDLPKTMTVAGFEYVVDEDEISTVWKDEPSTTSAIYIRSGLARWSKWSDTDGRDGITVDLIFTGHRETDLAHLATFNAQVSD